MNRITDNTNVQKLVNWLNKKKAASHIANGLEGRRYFL
ncbi:hypothetical protein DSUL_20076 [Desulfovibrionales bacterium]